MEKYQNPALSPKREGGGSFGEDDHSRKAGTGKLPFLAAWRSGKR